jgi:osmotically-inducible protein OsmY
MLRRRHIDFGKSENGSWSILTGTTDQHVREASDLLRETTRLRGPGVGGESTGRTQMSFDTDLTADVNAELFWDPKVDNTAVAASASDGTITLRGTVGSLREKREAKRAAQRVVTLSGAADWQYQRDEADFVASNIVGALDVFNEIELIHPSPNADDAEDSITRAFERNAALDADDLSISTANGTVTLQGNVRSWAQRDEALDAAWAAPGVTSVRDEMTVGY